MAASSRTQIVPVPKNVVNKKIYAAIKLKMRKQHKKEKKRWSAYSSSQLVKEYKAKGGTYTKNTRSARKLTGIGRWHAEKWIDVCMLPEIVPCGRSSIRSKTRKEFPYCRPSVRISSNTPKTYLELSRHQIHAKCNVKKNMRSIRKK